jgi:hypothetical protein
MIVEFEIPDRSDEESQHVASLGYDREDSYYLDCFLRGEDGFAACNLCIQEPGRADLE